ncbi:putative O-linked N-acetylglucosamine transferase (SPINDLY family) [Pararhizobium capsulatum DSM 1112]|uniref:O-linked N-acetylglucosamine transferase (SPINDLY family) n=1 Tax=Pararhizobium capsulatum DSM 1112 TaxID=1121113 RepID=A0ABU0BRT8_9HYPH|nr:hypothetical protein [Pararhizobium capsulatum]MDQ0320642.1 putative O-linked N-acetylglucosamine transferase (SPINDLY family) [Pararhizobium capsulatum DSM 1112]
MTIQGFAAATAAFERADYMEALTILSGALDGERSSALLALLGSTLQKLGLPAEAADAFEQAAHLCEGDPGSLLKLAAEAHFQAGNDEAAQLIGIRLQDATPEDADLAFILTRSFLRTGDTALASTQAPRLAGSDRREHVELAAKLVTDDERSPIQLTLFSKLAALDPDDPYAQFKYLSVARNFCDFEAIEAIERTFLPRAIEAGAALLQGETGYSNLLHCADERLNRLATNNPATSGTDIASLARQRRMRPHRWTDKIRIGYLSNDLWDDHATMRLFQSVLTAHDPDRFDITLYCYTPERFVDFDGGNRKNWGRIVAIRKMSDAEAADAIRRDGIDILVDLKGHTGGSRSAILNRMVAPIQVAWLGFPGSGAEIDCDYAIGDHIVLPDTSKPHYHEKFCRLPESYQPNDPVHRTLPAAKSRAELGLPEDKVVLAAFNTARKITLPVLDCWATILVSAPQTVLWAMIDGELARSNFLKAMEKRGVSAEQIIFTPKTDYASHIARLQAADLGLDTFPYNGHTTTSDQLWAGLPVVTKRGSNFASRVSESLLMALGVPELVADGRDGFVELAVRLSGSAEERALLKQTIANNRFLAPLFDAERFCRHLETAYEAMAARGRNRLPPEHFDVPALPARTSSFR